jgi:hypothetical protein
MMSHSFRSGLPAAAVLVGALSGCGLLGEPTNPSAIARPPTFDPPGGQSKCKLSASQMRPLIVEWSAADRAALEVLAQRGTVVVRYVGCEMEILPRCSAPGSYRYAATTRKTEQVVIQDTDELYANLPMGAVKLEGKLERAGQLNVTMNVVGQYDTDQTTVQRDTLEGDCAKATHVVTGLTVGAFAFSAGGSASVGGGASALGAGAGAESSHRQELLSSDGDVSACESSTRSDTEPPASCGALLRLSVAELARPEPSAALACPEGTQVIDGKCVAGGTAGTGNAVVASSSRLRVRVTCGHDRAVLGESEGIELWIDGELTSSVEEVREYNPLTPGGSGILQYVAYDATPGRHSVRIEADGCEAVEQEIEVKPNVQRDVNGRLRPTAWYRSPPANTEGLGLAAGYYIYAFDSLVAEDQNFNDVSLKPDTMRGYGFEVPTTLGYLWGSAGFHWTKGDLPFEAPACPASMIDSCLPARTKVEGSASGYHVPIWLAGRLPFVHGAAMLGSGIEFNVVSIDFAEAEDNFAYTSSNLGLHAPIWAGIELRPTCGLAFTARVAQGFSLMSDVSSYRSVSASLALFRTFGCSEEDFGIR